MIKWFDSKVVTAMPEVTNTQGDLVNMLNALLVNGINFKPIISISHANGVCTLDVGNGHGFVLHSVVDIQGSAQQALIGTEFRVEATTPTTISFSCPTSVINETGLTVRYAPIGWTSHFTSAGRACYKSKDMRYPAYLRVDDVKFSGTATVAAKFAGVEICENMSSFDTVIGAQSPFEPNYPLQNRQTLSGRSNGWFKWYYSAVSGNGSLETSVAAPAGKKNYALIGDESGFYLILYPDGNVPVMYGVYHTETNTHLLANNGYSQVPYETRNPLDVGGYNFCICSLYGFQGMPTDNREYVTPVYPFLSVNLPTSFNQLFLKRIAMKNVSFDVVYGTLPHVFLSDTRKFDTSNVVSDGTKRYLSFVYSSAALFFEVT